MGVTEVTKGWYRNEILVGGLSEPISHYTDVVTAGPLVFISGCGPTDSSGGLVSDDIRDQARQVHENLGLALAATGCDFGSVSKVVVYLTDIADRAAVDELRREFFGHARPASTLIQVSGLAIPGMKVEIQATALRKDLSPVPPWERREFKVAELREPISHYTHVVTIGPLAFISGCGPSDRNGNVAEGDVHAQARQVHENLKSALHAIGCDFGCIARVTVYLTDMADRIAVDELRKEYFGQARPTSTLVEISALAAKGGRVEIDAIAVLNP